MISIILISFELNASVSFVLVALVAIVDFLSSLDPFRSSGNFIGDAGVTSLSEALEWNTTLTSLDLSGECVASFFVFFCGRAHLFGGF